MIKALMLNYPVILIWHNFVFRLPFDNESYSLSIVAAHSTIISYVQYTIIVIHEYTLSGGIQITMSSLSLDATLRILKILRC